MPSLWVGVVCLMLVGLCVCDQGLQWQVYNNTAMMGAPVLDVTVPTLAISHAGATPFSGELLGTVTFPQDGVVKLTCNFSNTSVAFVWIADHLVCQDGNVYKPPPGDFDNPIFVRAGEQYVVRAHVYFSLVSECKPSVALGCYNDSNHGCGFSLADRSSDLTLASCATLCSTKGLPVAGPETGSECWCGAAAPSKCAKVSDAECNVTCPGDKSEDCGAPGRLQAFTYTCESGPASAVTLSVQYNYFNKTLPAPLPLAWLQTQLPTPELRRRELQSGLVTGWGSWLHHSIMAVVKLPEVDS